MSKSPLGPTDVVLAVASGVGRLISEELDPFSRDDLLDELANLYAEVSDVRHPFSPLPSEPLRCREDLRRHFAGALSLVGDVESFKPSAMVVHQTTDPEVVIAEFLYVGSANGRAFALPNVFVVRVRDGQIVESRDYSDHVAFARAFNRLDALAGALAGETREGN
jgi:ketosteroid isomerase-like protein